ncbi:hypothetical protein [Pseudobacteriovorax antillogorgiicola]|uniref:Uncharacterized protein n=1 Tax=Pseudobacteriovorax antillogorgiicola TaxID=1513793 RepID=A0A1Y6CL15_9BACT|nr:hypothetical protein [Pseudobacteriovorax antillogorgiicola]TCS45637.1 hypothetical protein EDD56_12729 [Pseudobacteriovorax antillogorgiicola]SMF72696.1 hypothetical protein SAMN06296036_12728 [Pseudobacteriovorax antillogorgiicola]
MKKKLISRKKDTYRVSESFDRYLRTFNRGCRLAVHYEDLLRFSDSFALYDKNGDDTLWVTVNYPQGEQQEVHDGLLQIYAFLRADGNLKVCQHLVVDRVDLCLYGNTKPFRIRIMNTLNENFDYFYVKEADASRIYGLELEHILSPNRIGFMFFENTLIEEHIYGIPGDVFANRFLMAKDTNKVRVAKEFVKFNERCFLRLLGDMHSANFVVDITMDFEENFYRIRCIDFDQQSYEPTKKVYLPQFFVQNSDYVKVVMDFLSPESVDQYQKEERALIKSRAHSAAFRLDQLLNVMRSDMVAPYENVLSLRQQMSDHYQDDKFLKCDSMGALVAHSLARLEQG